VFPESPLVEVFEREVRRTVHHECEYDAEFTWRGRMESAARDVPGLNSRTLEEAGAEICYEPPSKLEGATSGVAYSVPYRIPTVSLKPYGFIPVCCIWRVCGNAAPHTGDTDTRAPGRRGRASLTYKPKASRVHAPARPAAAALTSRGRACRACAARAGPGRRGTARRVGSIDVRRPRTAARRKLIADRWAARSSLLAHCGTFHSFW